MPRTTIATAKFAKAAADFGATVLLSNHTEFDNGYDKAHTVAGRKPGAANPFDVGRDAVARYFTVVQTCTAAARLRALGKSQEQRVATENSSASSPPCRGRYSSTLDTLRDQLSNHPVTTY